MHHSSLHFHHTSPTQPAAPSAKPSALHPLLIGTAMLAALLSGCANPSGSAGTAAAKVPASDFYAWTDKLPANAPGQLLRSEPLDAAASLADAGDQLRILYTSTEGVSGKGLVPVSGAVFFPRTPQPAGGWPVIAWAHGTVGVGDACAPSRNPRSARDKEYLNTWLREGYVVVATDYQGLGTPGPHPYLHTRSQAYSVLDSVRAVVAMPGVANKVVLVGQSQGGGAAFGTAGIAQGYAPDIHLLGTVATGTPYLTAATVQQSSGQLDRVSPQLAYTMYATVTAKLMKPEFDPASVFLPEAQADLQASAETCVGPMFDRLSAEKRTERNTMQPGGAAKVFGAMGSAANYVTLDLPQPVFMGTGGKDVDVPTAMQKSLVAAACKAGSKIQWHLYPDKDHSGTVNASLPDSLPFVRRLMAGQTVDSNCGG